MEVVQETDNDVAKDALQDWIETNTPIITRGPQCNLPCVADDVLWGRRFHASCGRLVPFLGRFGRHSATDPSEIEGISGS